MEVLVPLYVGQRHALCNFFIMRQQKSENGFTSSVFPYCGSALTLPASRTLSFRHILLRLCNLSVLLLQNYILKEEVNLGLAEKKYMPFDVEKE